MGRYSNPQPQYLDDAGEPLSGGKLYYYTSGTSDLKNTYSNFSLTVPNTNPVILDGEGRPSNDIFLDGSYKVRLTTSADVLVWEKDPVGSADSGIASFSEWSNSVTYDADNIVEYDAKFYLSLSNGNINKAPDTSTSDWEQIRYIGVAEADFTDGTFLTLDQIRPYASNAEAIAGLLDNKSVTPAALSATFTDFETNTLATVATTGAYTDLAGTPTLATVATTGSYTDLINKPTIPSALLEIRAPGGSATMTNAYDLYIVGGVSAVTMPIGTEAQGFAVDTAISIFNNSTADTTITTPGTIQQLNGVANGSCTLPSKKGATIVRISTNVCVIAGGNTDVS